MPSRANIGGSALILCGIGSSLSKSRQARPATVGPADRVRCRVVATALVRGLDPPSWAV